MFINLYYEILGPTFAFSHGPLMIAPRPSACNALLNRTRARNTCFSHRRIGSCRINAVSQIRTRIQTGFPHASGGP